MADTALSEPPTSGAARPVESIRRRYVATLLAQVTQLALSVITAGIVPRALGPAVYGSYNFLLGMAATIRAFIDPSAQQTFFTFSSQGRRTGPLTKLYGTWLAIQLALILSLIGVLSGLGVREWLWPGQKLDQIIGIAILDWTMLLAVTLRQLGDSKGLTVRPQAISAGISLISLAGLLGLTALHRLNFYSYLWLNLFTSLVLCLVLGYWLLVLNRELSWAGQLRGRVREYLARWWGYASPLLLLEIYTPVVPFLNTYLLQSIYGSVEQAYYALALRWSALVAVFTNAMVMIFWREIASSLADGNRDRAAHIYLRFNRLLFFLAVVLCFWLSMSSRVLVLAFAGEQYRGAIPVLMIMAFYPVQQTFGQLSTVALKAAERTAHYRNLSFFLSLPDLLLTYFLLAPSTAAVPGLGLGAIGAAARMVGYGLLSVQVYEWSNFRFFHLNYGWATLQRIMIAAVVGGGAALILVGLPGLVATRWQAGNLPSLAVSSSLYFGLVGALVLLWPGLAGLSRAEIFSSLHLLLRRLRLTRAATTP